jgi:chemotaxis protein methyltransferase CheR
LQATHDDVLAVSRLVHDLCGLTLDTSKAYLIESRLGGIAQAAGCSTFSDLVYKTRAAPDHALKNQIIDAITTNETLFFRDDSPYDMLQNKLLPDLIDRRSNSAHPKRLRIWSAGCSTGQEPYSIAMTLAECIPNISAWDVSILGTDISNAAVRQASAGRYAKLEIQRGMKPHLLARYFHEEAGGWRVKDELRAMVTFNHRNLLVPFIDLGPFDLIFCRKGAIYFDPPSRRDFFLRLADRLVSDGCLVVGSSECLIDLGPQFHPQHHCRGTCYMPHQVEKSFGQPFHSPQASATPITVPPLILQRESVAVA